MATRGNRPRDPEDTKGGVIGTHGLGEEQQRLEGAGVDRELEAEEKKERNVTTEVVPGPGPKDKDAGRATQKHLETHGLK